MTPKFSKMPCSCLKKSGTNDLYIKIDDLCLFLSKAAFEDNNLIRKQNLLELSSYLLDLKENYPKV